MVRDKMERWIPALTLLTVGGMLAQAAVEDAGLQSGLTASLAIVVAVAAWWVSPLRRGPHIDHAQAQAQAGNDDLVVYWKPGCSYCIRLLRGLNRRERNRILWVNVWKDNDAARFVADRNDGNVLTPTVLTGAGRRLPMSVEAVRSHLEQVTGW